MAASLEYECRLLVQGRRVVVDDNLPTRAGTTDGTVYTTYLFGQGAFGKGILPRQLPRERPALHIFRGTPPGSVARFQQG